MFQQLVLLNARCALWHASSKNVTYNNYFLVKMLTDFLPSSCFLHSGEIIRNDFILTAQMNTRWSLGYYYCRQRAGYGDLNRGLGNLQRDLSLKIMAGVDFQLEITAGVDFQLASMKT